MTSAQAVAHSGHSSNQHGEPYQKRLSSPGLSILIDRDPQAWELGTRIRISHRRRVVLEFVGDIAERVATLLALHERTCAIVWAEQESLVQEGATFASASAGMLETCRRLLARVESDKAPDITSANDHRDFLSHRDSLVANVHTWIDDDAQAVELNSHWDDELLADMHNTADSVASFLACREAIGRILDPLSWLEHVFRASYSETTMTSAFFHWSSYVRAHPGHPALAVSYQEIPDEEFREMSRAEQERSVLFLDDRGIPRGASGFDESAAVPCEVSEFRIVTPSLRGPDDTVVIGNGAVLYDLDVGMVDQRDDALFRRKKHDLLAVHFLPLSSRFLDGSGRWPIIRDMWGA